MPERAQVAIGRVGRPHGVRGAFVVEGASETPERFAEGKTVHVAGEPATIVESKRARGRPVIRLDRQVPRGAELQVPREALGPPEPDAFYVFQLVGLRVEEEGGRALGTVTAVLPGPANDVLELDSGLLLPLVEACVRGIHLEESRIDVSTGFAGSDHG